MRTPHIDVARALCISLVVWGHSDLGQHVHTDIQAMLQTVRMPLLFILAGTFMQPQRALWQNAWHKGEALLKPYLVMAIILAPLHIVVQKVAGPADYALDVLSFNGAQIPGWLFPMWFLCLLWVLHLGCALLIRHTRFDTLSHVQRATWVTGLLTLGFVLVQQINGLQVALGEWQWTVQGLPFSLDLAPLGAGFCMIGYWLRADIRAWRISPGAAALALAVFIGIHVLYHPQLDMLKRVVQEPSAVVIAAISGSVALVGAAHATARLPALQSMLAHVGRLSLYVLLFHAPIQSRMGKALATAVPAHEELAWWLAWAATLAVCVGMGQVIERVVALRMLFEPMGKLKPAGRPASTPLPVPAQRGEPAQAALLQQAH
jgi:fucose 4-O-acetylase-like acetyltransferase